MKYSESNKPIVCMQKNSTCYKKTSTMTPKGILWHSTGANNPYISRYVQPFETDENYDEMIALLGKNRYKNDWNHIVREAGLNCWIGKLADDTVTTVQTMPWNYKPWGCGGGPKGSCNDGWIQFEICEDNLTNKDYFNKAYTEACEITAYLCKLYNIDPKGTVTHNGVKVPTILCHQDSYKLGLGGNHGDVYHWFKKHDKDMDDVRNDVAKLMGIVNNRGLQATSLKNLDNAAVIAKVGPLFTADQKKNGVLASVSLAQFILESGYGKSELGQNANNMFGMKRSLSGNTWSGSTWDGSVYTKETKEYVNGGYITITADFRKYVCVEDSIADHSAYLIGAKKGTELRYAGLKGEANYRVAAQIIKDGGYATSPTYVDNLCDIIEKWNLTKYDAVQDVTKPEDTNKFKLGDEVKLVSGATYASGKGIPSWVFSKTLYVRAINGDKIVISILKTGDITGTVYKKDLVPVEDAVVEPAPVPAPNPVPDKKEETVKFKIGDEVKLGSGAKYASGKSIPSWVFDRKLYVREIHGENIVVSILQTGAVTGTVNVKYLVSYNSDVKVDPAPADVEFKLGETVKLIKGAKYASGQAIPSWVFNKTLYVREINGDKIIISTRQTGAITGTVNKKYLTKC